MPTRTILSREERHRKRLSPVTVFGLAAALNALLFVAGPSEAVRAAEDAALVLYVDANHGNDGKDGLSPQAGLRTLTLTRAASTPGITGTAPWTISSTAAPTRRPMA
jgi:hypothetical protein